MRTLTDHKVNGLNEAIDINVQDEPGAGGANHRYELNLHCVPGEKPGLTADHTRILIEFQKGPIGEYGYNGFTNEALLAIVIDRMRGFQSGKFSCRENALALTKLEEALMWLQKRTRDRIARGVEGTHTP